MFNVAIGKILTMNLSKKIDHVNWKKYAEHYKKHKEGDEISSHLLDCSNKVFSYCGILTPGRGYEIKDYPLENDTIRFRFSGRQYALELADAFGVSDDKIICVD